MKIDKTDKAKSFFKELQSIYCDLYGLSGAEVLLAKQTMDSLYDKLGRFPDSDEIDRELSGLGIRKAVLELDRSIRSEFQEKETLAKLSIEEGLFDRVKANLREANAIKGRYYLGGRVEGD